MWRVYILQCSDGTYYTGMTKDLKRRVQEHNFADCGAKYTKIRRPVILVWSSDVMNRNDAAKEEMRIKGLTRKQKERLLYP